MSDDQPRPIGTEFVVETGPLDERLTFRVTGHADTPEPGTEVVHLVRVEQPVGEGWRTVREAPEGETL